MVKYKKKPWILHNLAEDKIEAFKQEWEEKWKPTLGLGTSQQSGGYFDGAIQ